MEKFSKGGELIEAGTLGKASPEEWMTTP